MAPGTLPFTWIGYAGKQTLDGDAGAIRYGLLALLRRSSQRPASLTYVSCAAECCAGTSTTCQSVEIGAIQDSRQLERTGRSGRPRGSSGSRRSVLPALQSLRTMAVSARSTSFKADDLRRCLYCTGSKKTAAGCRGTTMTESKAPPILSGKHYEEDLAFIPTSLLREARRQKGLADRPVPEVCVLDPYGDIVRQAKGAGRGSRVSADGLVETFACNPVRRRRVPAASTLSMCAKSAMRKSMTTGR
jgi:hypothetical protein